jgi:hypothetical protein
MKTRIMYLESKASDEAYIGRVTFSKTGQTIYYREWVLHKIPGGGISANYREANTGVEFWISGPKKDGKDRLFRQRVPVEIDDDIRVEYWSLIRNLPGEKRKKNGLV